MSLLPESDADWGRQIRLALTSEAARPLEEIKRQSPAPSRNFSDFEAAMSEWSFAYGIAWAIARLRDPRSEEHTSELQSHVNLVCRLLLEKKKKIEHNPSISIED